MSRNLEEYTNVLDPYMQRVAVIGSADDSCACSLLRLTAWAAGKLLAEQGMAVLVDGKKASMSSAVTGAKEVGGATVSFTTLGCDLSGADTVIMSGVARGCQSLDMIGFCDGVLAIAGDSGTMLELCLAYMHKKPIVALTGLGGWVDLLHHTGMKYLDAGRTREILFTDDLYHSVETLCRLLDKKRQIRRAR